MKKVLALVVIGVGLFFSTPSMAQNRDEEMINASLRFIKENANLSKKEYQNFAKIYIDYNEQLAKLNRETTPESRDYMKRWSQINDEYMKKLEKALPDTTRQKIGVAQWELGQKVWNQRAEQNRQHAERQFQMMGQWTMINPQFRMMQPHMFDFQRMRQQEMQQDDQKQQQWWENYWQNWQAPDSAMMKRMEEYYKRFQGQDSIWQRGPQFGPMPMRQATPQFAPQPGRQPFIPQYGPQQGGMPQAPGNSGFRR